MVFSSPIFLYLFLPLVFLFNYLFPKRSRNIVLLLSSLFFYFWGEGLLVILMLFSISINYFFGRIIHALSHPVKIKIALYAAVLVNLLLLIYFKYFNFFVGNFELVAGSQLEFDEVRLPIGISFFTFQGISYLIDIYRKESIPQKNIINVGLYISLFPQLIAGPIVRYNTIANQLTNRIGNSKDIIKGFERFIWGLGKKVLIANPLGLIADKVFGLAAHEIPTPIAWLGIICYSLQLYYDFSGYSDMAIGLGRIFGFRFLENFNYPYISKSIREFWRRWHISLSSWFRDYLYIPLGGNKKGKIITLRNLIIVFFLTGLWHGASWNFVLWGLYHGLFLIAERGKFSNLLKKNIIGNVYLILVVIMGWVLFRSESISYAIQYYRSLFGFSSGSNYYPLIYMNYYITFLLFLAILFSAPLKDKIRVAGENFFSNLNHFWISKTIKILYIVLIFLVLISSLMMISSDTYNPFIYFRF